MDGELLSWKRVYQVVRRVGRACRQTARRGAPDRYKTEDVALWLLWAAWRNQPVSRVSTNLLSLRMHRLAGFPLPATMPAQSTLSRRGKRLDFQALMQSVLRRLRVRLRPNTKHCFIDSTPLPVGRLSHDPDARLGFNRLRGYRWHTLVSADQVVLAAEVAPANVAELTIARTLVTRACQNGVRIRWLVGDAGYDSEPLHQLVAEQLGRTRLIAQVNARGHALRFTKTPLRARMHREWQRPVIQGNLRARSQVERFYSVVKSSRFGLYGLPPWVRRTRRVTQWLQLKTVLYHGSLLTDRKIAA